METSWLDRVPAVPTLGFMFEPAFSSQHDYFSNLQPWWESWRGEGKNLVITQEKVIDFRFEAVGSGLTFKVSPENLVTEFRYPFDAGEVQFPKPTPAPEIRRYTDLLTEVRLEGAKFVSHVLGRRPRKLLRVGVVADCKIMRTELPPGATALLAYLAKPWAGGLLQTNARLSAVLLDNDERTEQCHHVIDEERNRDFVNVRLDWQRVWKQPRTLAGSDVDAVAQEMVKSALTYFETFARGDFFP